MNSCVGLFLNAGTEAVEYLSVLSLKAVTAAGVAYNPYLAEHSGH